MTKDNRQIFQQIEIKVIKMILKLITLKSRASKFTKKQNVMRHFHYTAFIKTFMTFHISAILKLKIHFIIVKKKFELAMYNSFVLFCFFKSALRHFRHAGGASPGPQLDSTGNRHSVSCNSERRYICLFISDMKSDIICITRGEYHVVSCIQLNRSDDINNTASCQRARCHEPDLLLQKISWLAVFFLNIMVHICWRWRLIDTETRRYLFFK